MAERASGRWTAFLRKKQLEGEGFFVSLKAVSRIFEGADQAPALADLARAPE